MVTAAPAQAGTRVPVVPVDVQVFGSETSIFNSDTHVRNWHTHKPPKNGSGWCRSVSWHSRVHMSQRCRIITVNLDPLFTWANL
jgi:hypothetical protein